MQKNRVKARRIVTQRLDPNYYHPQYLKDEDALEALDYEYLGKAGRFFVGPFGSKLPSSLYLDKGIPLFRISNIGTMEIDFSGMAYLHPSVHQDLSSSEVLPGDILIVKASVGEKLCKIPEAIPKANITQHIIALRPNKSFDVDYIASFLLCNYGERQLKRRSLGSLIQYLGVSDTKTVILPKVDRLVQNYIGDKVRLAEKLRERSKELESQAKKLFENELFWDRQLEAKKIHGRVEFKDLEQRLDINFNSPNRLSLLQHLRKNNISTEPLADLVEISAMIGWKGLTTNHYTNEGPWLLRGVEFSDGVIDFDSLVSIKKFKYDEQPQIHLKEGDIAFTKDGTIGKAIVIPHLSNDLAAGSTVARLRLYSENRIDLYYLEYALNHPVLQIQIMSFATGMAQPHITQEWIAKLQIPRCIAEEEIGNKIKLHHECLIESGNLTTAAKYLVEALIEGKLTETELKNAQTALLKEDIEPDKAILTKLTRKGYDIANEPPLFPDLDTLYQAIKEINLTSEL